MYLYKCVIYKLYISIENCEHIYEIVILMYICNVSSHNPRMWVISYIALSVTVLNSCSWTCGNVLQADKAKDNVNIYNNTKLKMKPNPDICSCSTESELKLSFSFLLCHLLPSHYWYRFFFSVNSVFEGVFKYLQSHLSLSTRISMSSDFPHYSFRMPNIGFQNLPLNIYIVVFGTAIFVFILSLLFCCYLIR